MTRAVSVVLHLVPRATSAAALRRRSHAAHADGTRSSTTGMAPLYDDPPNALELRLPEPRLLEEKSRLPTLELPPRL
jgi:hypothetical protein